MSGTSLLFWSGGMDSALALHEILRGDEYEAGALVTTVTEEYDRVSMHVLRRSLLERQSNSLGFPLEEVDNIAQRIERGIRDSSRRAAAGL